MIYDLTKSYVLPPIYRGDTWQFSLTWKDANGTAINLTGYTARMQFRRSGTLEFELTSAGGDITLGGVAGTVACEIAAAVTELLTPGMLTYDLEFTLPDTTIRTLIRGRVQVIRDESYDE